MLTSCIIRNYLDLYNTLSNAIPFLYSSQSSTSMRFSTEFMSCTSKSTVGGESIISMNKVALATITIYIGISRNAAQYRLGPSTEQSRLS